MKVKFSLTMARDGVGAAGFFEADVSWLPLQVVDKDKMETFRPGDLWGLDMAFEDGAVFRFIPPLPAPPGALGWLRNLLWGDNNENERAGPLGR